MSNATNTHTAANTALDHMGGAGKVQAMLGARNFVALKDGIQFHFRAKNRVGANAVRVTVDASTDLYSVEFFSIRNRGMDVGQVGLLEEIQAEDLKATMEDTLGLDLSL